MVRGYQQNVYLKVGQKEKIEQIASDYNLTRPQLIKKIVEELIKGHESRQPDTGKQVPRDNTSGIETFGLRKG